MEEKMREKLLLKNLTGRDYLKNLNVDGMIILNGSWRNRMRICGLDFFFVSEQVLLWTR